MCLNGKIHVMRQGEVVNAMWCQGETHTIIVLEGKTHNYGACLPKGETHVVPGDCVGT